LAHESRGVLRPRSVCCPNCHEINHGLEDREGIVRITCKRCKSVMVQKRMGRRHNRIDVYAPEDRNELTCNK